MSAVKHMVSQELVNELKTIIKEDYGRNLSFEEASRIANDLVGYFDQLAKMYHQNNENKYELSRPEVQ